MSYHSTITIEEIAVNNGGTGRIVILGGPSLPFRGANWPGHQRVVTTWYPGNSIEATQGVLGPTEMPSHWQGEWNRTRMSRAPAQWQDVGGDLTPVVEPYALWNILEAIFRGGQRLRVTWAVSSDDNLPSQTGKVVREGRCTDWDFKPDRIQDIAWDMTWEWMSRGGSTPRVTSVRGNLIQNTSAAYLAKITALVIANTAAVNLNRNPNSLTLGQIEQFASTPSKLADSLARQVQAIGSQVQQVVDIASTLATQPVQVAQRATSLARNTVAQTNNFYQSLSQIPYETMTNRLKFDGFIRASVTFANNSDLAQDAARQGREFAAQLRQTVQATALTGALSNDGTSTPAQVQQVYTCKAGDTPEGVSQLFYSTSDHAVDILRANRLAWHTSKLNPGKILIIPNLSNATTTQGV